MKNLKYIILWLFVAIYLAVALGFVAEKRLRLVCNNVEVHIVDSLRNSFISGGNIKNLLQRKRINLIGKNLSDICLDSLELLINNYPPVERAEVYKTTEGKVVIDVEQRNPIIRVIDSNNDSYYIDRKGYVMRLSENYTSNVIIANGFIHAKAPGSKVSVLELEKSAGGTRVILADLFKLATYITDNKFLNAQVQQIFVEQSGDFELVPRVGPQVIILGDMTGYEEKFSNLMSLYKNGLPAVGWNKYESINLKYKGQVICTKREQL
jgi:cell division protein FtsQ